MKRLHVHVSVDDLVGSVTFYTALFGAGPTVSKPDYAKWMLDNPCVNFAISARGGKAGVDHFGIQVETPEELSEVYGRLRQAERPVLEEGATTCCYANSEKAWTSDPQGLLWESFLTTGDSTVYGDDGALKGLRAGGGAKAESSPCCSAKPAPAAETACCSGAEARK